MGNTESKTRDTPCARIFVGENLLICLLPFVLQVDRLEQELAELRRSQEEQATAAAARAQTTGVLEEYRTRAQQALKRANEITSQTASENKRLQVSGCVSLRAMVTLYVLTSLTRCRVSFCFRWLTLLLC